MRLTDDRYTQQRYRLEIALRMIRFEARTSTIRECTGISEDRIRKLHRTYLCERGMPHLHRKRGKSPQQIHCLTRNLTTRVDSVLLAGIFCSSGALAEAAKTPRRTLCLNTAERICDAYELFAKLRPASERCGLTFEHAWFLARALLDGNELTTSQCPRCAGLTLKDLYEPRHLLCPLCETKRLVDRGENRRGSDRTSERHAMSNATTRKNHP